MRHQVLPEETAIGSRPIQQQGNGEYSGEGTAERSENIKKAKGF